MMYTVSHIKTNTDNFLEIESVNQANYAKVNLCQGGSLQDLKLNNQLIISSKDVLPYEQSFASAILFPFTNRIEKGQYNFNDTFYQLNCNKTDELNAIHGLVYDKTFEILEIKNTETSALVSIVYKEDKQHIGFPFKYKIILNYELSHKCLKLSINVLNEDINPFPFGLGWHPYFFTSNLFESSLSMRSDNILRVNTNMIPIGQEKSKWEGHQKIEHQTFDDCFILKSNGIEFKTPDYHFDLLLSEPSFYLQIYTPENRKTIAIEPQTAPANSFNNKIGVQILNPNEHFNSCWTIQLK